MIEAEPAIRQLLKLDFEQKVKETVMRTFRQTINQTLNTHLLAATEYQAEEILQKYDLARAYLAQTLDKEAEEKIKSNERKKAEVEQKIEAYNHAIGNINSCLEIVQLDRKKLPSLSQSDLVIVPSTTDSSLGDLELAESDRANPTVDVAPTQV
jgi:hypothetical protein